MGAAGVGKSMGRRAEHILYRRLRISRFSSSFSLLDPFVGNNCSLCANVYYGLARMIISTNFLQSCKCIALAN